MSQYALSVVAPSSWHCDLRLGLTFFVPREFLVGTGMGSLRNSCRARGAFWPSCYHPQGRRPDGSINVIRNRSGPGKSYIRLSRKLLEARDAFANERVIIYVDGTHQPMALVPNRARGSRVANQCPHELLQVRSVLRRHGFCAAELRRGLAGHPQLEAETLALSSAERPAMSAARPPSAREAVNAATSGDGEYQRERDDGL